jgi:hypothetical protein
VFFSPWVSVVTGLKVGEPLTISSMSWRYFLIITLS